jgi:hypothetical protein
MWMFGPTVRRKIVGISLGLIVLMLITSVPSMIMSRTVRHLLDELTYRYIPTYSQLASTTASARS